jgi:hypothetical protein
MTAASSPAELNRQRLVVGELALRAEADRRRLVGARRAAAAKLRAFVTSPWVVGGCFVLGWVIFSPAPRRRGATIAVLAARLSRAGAALAWLARFSSQFQSGVAAGAALMSRPRVAEGAAGHGTFNTES